MRLLPKPSYYLLFGYSGDFSLMINRNNDGAVSLASELDARAQTAARKMNGFMKTTAASSPALRSPRWSIRS
jgi:hypothetical protein